MPNADSKLSVAARVLKKIENALLRSGVRWSNVSIFMKLRISQIATAIPLIGYAFLWSEKFKEVLILQDALGQGIWTDTIGRLKLLYFGALFLSASWLVYAIRCPEFIKRFQNVDEYLFQQMQLHDNLSLSRVVRLLRELILVRENDGPVIREYLAIVPITLVDKIGAEHLLSMTRSPYAPENRSGLYLGYYYWKDGTRVWSAWASTTLFAVGVLMVLIPSLEVFLLVISKMFSGIRL